MTPTKMATCRENTRPTKRVMTKVVASERVALETVCICRALINEAPMKITKVARAGKGTKETRSPSRK